MKDIKGRPNRWHSYSWIFVFAVLLVSCGGKKELSAKEYLKWMNNDSNGMVSKKELSGVVYELRYVTPEWMALNEIKSLNPSKKEFENVRKNYGSMNYLNLRIYDKSGGYINRYLEKMGADPDRVSSYLNYKADKDWKMIENKDTAKCALYAFSNTYGFSKEYDVQMAFPVNNNINGADKTFEWTDQALNNGTLKFLFRKSDLDRIPNIRI